MELNRSNKLQKLNDKYNEEQANISNRQQKLEKKVQEIKEELKATKQELEKAMDATQELSNEANLKREGDLRRKVAEMELDLEEAQARKIRSFTVDSVIASAIKNEAMVCDVAADVEENRING